MTQRRCATILAILFVTALSVAAQSTAQRRDIVLDLTLPNGGTPQLRGADGATAMVELPKVGRFAFVPTVQQDNAGVVVVEMFDLNRTPHQRIARLQVMVGGDRVQSGTTPPFGVRVPRVITR
jgi:hypothetical protein